MLVLGSVLRYLKRAAPDYAPSRRTYTCVRLCVCVSVCVLARPRSGFITGAEVLSAVSSIHGCDPRTFHSVQLALRLQWTIEMLVVGSDFRINP